MLLWMMIPTFCLPIFHRHFPLQFFLFPFDSFSLMYGCVFSLKRRYNQSFLLLILFRDCISHEKKKSQSVSRSFGPFPNTSSSLSLTFLLMLMMTMIVFLFTPDDSSTDSFESVSQSLLSHPLFLRSISFRQYKND